MNKSDDITKLAIALAEFPGYEFRSDGTVFSKRSNRVLKPIKMGEYLGFQLYDINRDLKKRYLHRIIAEAFHGACPLGNQCRHLDGDKTNNRADNLAWGTPSQNNLDKRKHGTAPEGENNPMSKLTNESVSWMRWVRGMFGSPFHIIAKGFGVSTMTAFRATTGQTWNY